MKPGAESQEPEPEPELGNFEPQEPEPESEPYPKLGGSTTLVISIDI